MDINDRLGFATSAGAAGRDRIAALEGVGGVELYWSGYRTRGGPTAERHGPEIHLRLADGLDRSSGGFAPSEGVNAWLGQQVLALQVRPARETGGLMINMTDVDPVHEDEFNDWYDTEHLERLSSQPGLLSAARFKVIRGAPVYVAIYRLSGPDVVQTNAWVTASMTPWTKRIGRFRLNNERWVLTPGGQIDSKPAL